MSDISMSLSGLEAVISGLDNLSVQSQADVQAIIEKHTNGTGDDSEALAPVRTGAMKASKVVTIGTLQGTVEYDSPALYVDQGHHTRSGSYVPPNPFLTAPFFQHAQQYEQDMQGVIK